MAYLNETQRQALLDELKTLSFVGAKRKLRGMDPESTIAFHRTSMSIGKWSTRYQLPTLGTQVTLIENYNEHTNKRGKTFADFELAEIVVEPLPDNKS